MYDQPVRLVHPITSSSSSSSYCSSRVQGQTRSAFFSHGSPLTTNLLHQSSLGSTDSQSLVLFLLFLLIFTFYSYFVIFLFFSYCSYSLLILQFITVSRFFRGLNSLSALIDVDSLHHVYVG